MAFQQVKKKLNQIVTETNLQLTANILTSLVENTNTTNTNNENDNSMDIDLSDTAFTTDNDETSINDEFKLISPQKVLKECTKILLEIENDRLEEDKQITSDEFEKILKERHNGYCQRKITKDEKALPLHEFVAACAITADQKSDKPFLFEKTKLSFTIMCSNCDASQEPIINRLQFEKWATKLYPLATKQNYHRVFLALASDGGTEELDNDVGTDDDSSRKGSFGRLRQRMTGGSSSNSNKSHSKSSSKSSLKEANTSKHDKSIYGGITMSRYCEYVKELELSFNIEEKECSTIKESLENAKECIERDFSDHERILYHIRGAADMTGLPPYYGFVILTDYHLIFQGTALTTRTTCIKLSDPKLGIERAKIGGFLKRDTALRVQCEQGTFTWNVVKIKSDVRNHLYWSIWTMIRAHELAQNVSPILDELEMNNDGGKEEMIMKIKRKILVEAADDVLRQNSLQNVLQGKDGKFDAVPFVRYATLKLKKEYVKQIRDEILTIEMKTMASDSVISSIYEGIMGRSGQQNEEQKREYMDPDEEVKLRKYKSLKKDFEREHKMKTLDKINAERREEFNLKEFFKYLKILRIEFEPLMFLYRLYKLIVHWRNPGLSMVVFIVLEFVAYFNWVHYIPAVLLIANGILLVSCKRDMEYTLLCFDQVLTYAGFNAEDFQQEDMMAEMYANQKSGKIANKKKDKWSILHRLKLYRYNYYKSTFAMGFQQKKLAELSVFLGRFRTIYKWEKEDKSQIFCLVSIVLGIFLWIAPLRYVFAICVFGTMFKNSPFKKQQKNKKGMIDRYLESIPPDIPQVDSDSDSASNDGDDDSSDSDDSDDDGKRSNGKIKRMKEKAKKKFRDKRSSSTTLAGGHKSSTDDLQNDDYNVDS